MRSTMRSAVVRLSVVVGTLALLLTGTLMTASAAPAMPHYTECQFTRAVAVWSTSNSYYYGGDRVQVWVTFDKLVDQGDTTYWCGKVRNHSQVRITGTHAGYITGYIHTSGGGCADCYYFNPYVYAASGTVDSWGAWKSVRCAGVQAQFDINGAIDPAPLGEQYVCA